MPVCYRQNHAPATIVVPRPAVIKAPMSPEDACLEILSAAADRGDKCPTNSMIADRLGYLSEGVSGNLIARLAKRGDITVRHTSKARRIVTITATGRETKAPLRSKGSVA